ncbi:FxSxx-COOH system tetratricopeptide repeat protein [Streptomyces daliensis]|uniref:Tetratricopeptide repeat protein n=1 Tax=Streptomyces daliensis TaxID=299421 RepID=A0A8T4IZ96_9ACTN|nr:tetratricopeptide repeat protein [Streptomyces daliensis]
MVAQRRQGEGGAREQGPAAHVVVAFPGYHRPWATWIAHTLERHGHRVTLQRWDPSREQRLEDALGDLQLATGRVLLVLSDWFFQLGPRREGEWNDVLRGYVADNAERFAAVNLTNRSLLPATAVLEPVDLWGVGEAEAERRLLTRLELPMATSRQVPDGAGSRYPNDPPAVWGEVPRRNPRFTGRDELLNRMQQTLMDAARGASACTLVGMSGIGKTQLAAEYAHRFSSDYDVVWWVNSDQRGTQRERFGELAPQLGLRSGSEPGERIRVVREALRRGEPYGRWLVIFDGWEDVEEATKVLPRGGSGHVLITSRNRAWGSSTDVVEVPSFERAESTGYLMRRAPHLSAQDADEVAVEFQDVPLQLAHAAAWLGESHMDAAEYLRKVREGEIVPLDEESGTEGYPQPTLASWSMMLNKLRQSEPRTVELLLLCTSFAPGRIPIGLARGLSATELPENLRWITSDLPDWARALDSLVNYSVVTREARSGSVGEPGPQQESVHMHRLVHSIVGQLTGREDRGVYRRVVRRLLAEADPGDPMDSRQWPRYAELMPHLGPSGALSSTDGRVQALVLHCLRYCFSSGEFRAGAELAEQVRDSWSRIMEPQAQPMLDLAAQQGSILRSSGRFREAYELDRSVLERLRASADGRDIALMLATNCLASDQRYLGQYAEALQVQREVVTTAHRLLGPEEWTTLNAQHNLGVGLRLLGRYSEAYEIDLDTLRRREEVLRARHSATLNSGTACARDLRLMGRYQEALARQELGMRLHVQVLGEQHPQTLWARHNLALCLRRAASTPQDIGGMLAALLEQHEQAHGRGHFTTLALLTDFGNYLREHGDLSQARDLITEAENGYRALLGQAHPVPTGMQSNTGLVLQAEGDRDGALNMFEQALVGLRTLLGDDHPWTLGCALNTAGGRNFTGRLEEACELSRDTLRRSRQMLGSDHPLTLSCEIALAGDLRALRERDEAGKVEEDALQRLTRSLGAQHTHTLSARQRVRPYWDFEPYLG